MSAKRPASTDASVNQNPTAQPEIERLPMTGVRVLDVGTFLAGPHAASILGEFGAEVLKIEHPIAGDPDAAVRDAHQSPRRHAGLADRGPQPQVGDDRSAARGRASRSFSNSWPSRMC